MSRIHTHYDNLKVTRNAPLEVIRAAYRAMAQKYHPDVNNSPSAEKTMRILNEAWHVLSDPARRAEHDRWIAQEEGMGDSTAKATRGSAQSKNPSGQSSRENLDPAWSVYKKGGFPGTSPLPESATPQRSSILEKLDVISEKKYRIALFVALAVPAVVIFYLRDTVPFWRKHERVPLPIHSSTSAPSPETTVQGDTSNTGERRLVFVPLDKKATVKPVAGLNPPSKAPDRDLQSFTGYLNGSTQGAMGGLSTFTIDNRQGGKDAVARIYLNGQKPAVRSIYVKGGDTFKALEIMPGRYVLRYRFIGGDATYEADRTFDLEEIATLNGTQFSNVTVTLFQVRDGNLKTKQVPADKF